MADYKLTVANSQIEPASLKQSDLAANVAFSMTEAASIGFPVADAAGVGFIRG